jgi:hypothetical protein
MKFKIVQLSQFNGNKAGIYSVYLSDEQKTLFECFMRENIITFKSEIININQTIIAINKKTGARETLFKFDEGIPGDGVCALYDNPNSNLRLYCIRYGNSLVILGGGGYKPKTIRRLQDDPKLKEENYFLREISSLITERIKSGEILFSEDGTGLYGNLEFEE